MFLFFLVLLLVLLVLTTHIIHVLDPSVQDMFSIVNANLMVNVLHDESFLVRGHLGDLEGVGLRLRFHGPWCVCI